MSRAHLSLVVAVTATMSLAAAGCGMDGSDDADVEGVTRALTAPPSVGLFYGGTDAYVTRLGAYLTIERTAKLAWRSVLCPSGGLCSFDVYRRTRNSLTGETITTKVDTQYSITLEDMGSWTPWAVEGSGRAEFWVVTRDGTVTSAPSNKIVINRCSNLYPNEYLYQDNPLYNCNATTRLYPQGDGNLVLANYNSTTKDYTTLIWKTGAKAGANRLYMQGDGNLVYSAQPADVAKWSTRTNSTSTHHNDGAMLWVPDDSAHMEVILLDGMGGGTTLWEWETGRQY
jgi:hypothetical protein